MQKVFGAENVSTGQILLGNVDAFENLTKGVTGTQTAYEMAEQNSNTLSNRLDELKNAWVNMLTGANGAGSALDSVKDIVRFVTDNLETIVRVGARVLMFFTAWKLYPGS